MKGYITMILSSAVFAVVGNFFGYWQIPGLEGMETFQQKQAVRTGAEEGAREKAEEISSQNEENVRRRREILDSGGGYSR